MGEIVQAFTGGSKVPAAEPPPPPPKPAVMPTPDDDAVKAARRRKIAAQVGRSGRLSTILTDIDSGGEKLGA